MKPLTIAFILLLAGVSLLLVLLKVTSPDIDGTVTATVQNHVLTQSLDGNRHYMVVKLADGSTIRLVTNQTSLCPVGSQVELNVISSTLGKTNTYQFGQCLPR